MPAVTWPHGCSRSGAGEPLASAGIVPARLDRRSALCPARFTVVLRDDGSSAATTVAGTPLSPSEYRANRRLIT